MKAKIIAVANQKGGVGKTVTAVNFAVGLVDEGKKVLVVDIDPQANASSYLGFDNRNYNGATIINLIDSILKQGCIEYNARNDWYTDDDRAFMKQLYNEMHTAIVHNEENGVDLIPSNITLAGVEMSLINSVYRNQALRIILSYIRDDYDYIIIDCGPTLGILLLNALVASDEVIVPIQAEEFAVDGIVQILNTIQNVRRAENHSLKIAGFLLTMIKENVIEYREIKKAMIEQFGNLVYSTAISRAVQVARSTSQHKPVVIIPGSKTGTQYRNFTQEYLRKEME